MWLNEIGAGGATGTGATYGAVGGTYGAAGGTSYPGIGKGGGITIGALLGAAGMS